MSTGLRSIIARHVRAVWAPVHLQRFHSTAYVRRMEEKDISQSMIFQKRPTLGRDWQSDRSPQQVKASGEIASLGKRRLWEDALAVYAAVADPDILVYEAAHMAMVRSLQLTHADDIFGRVPKKSLRMYTFHIQLMGRLRKAGRVDELLSIVKTSGLQLDASAYTTIIMAHGLCGVHTSAMQALAEMKAAGLKPDLPAYGAALTSCGRHGDLEAAEALIKEMDDAGLKPDVGHITCCINACIRRKDYQQARKLWGEFARRGLERNIIAYTCLIKCIGGRDAMTTVEAVQNEMQKDGVRRDAFFYNALLDVAVQSQNFEHFDRFLAAMAEAGLQRTTETDFRIRQAQMARAQSQQVKTSLPAGWAEAVDPGSGNKYYWMEKDPAGTTTWAHPAS